MRHRQWFLFIITVFTAGLLMGQSGPPKRVESRDGYPAGNYRVEINGTEQQGILQIIDLTPYRTGLRATVDQTGFVANRVFTKYITPPFKIIRIADYDHPSSLNQWVRDSIRARNSGQDPATKARSIDIVITDGGTDKITFRIKNAWIREIAYSDLDRSSGGKLKETLTIESKSIIPMF